MIWFLLTLPFRVVVLGCRSGVGCARLTHWTIRRMGYRRLFVFAAGVGVGLLVAPGPGADLRARLRAKLEELQGAARPAAEGPADLATRVRDELSSSPRTWHLPQPAVAVEGEGNIILTGEVPGAAASADLERVAAAVRGVVAVENRLTVPG